MKNKKGYEERAATLNLITAIIGLATAIINIVLLILK